MKAKFVKGTTYRGTLVNPGDILDLDVKDYQNFVHIWKDAEPAEDAKAPAAAEVHVDDKKGKKKL